MESMEETDFPERHAGRVIVLDSGGRVLLFEYDDPPPNGHHWNTPGGGLERGEDYHAGARRELAEETGWHDIEVPPEVVHQRTVVMEYGGRIVRQVERFFLARVPHGGGPSRSWTPPARRSGRTAWRTWSESSANSSG
jgi:ADP-ribose pyrophosphatase YjhB (NUDIX family)